MPNEFNAISNLSMSYIIMLNITGEFFVINRHTDDYRVIFYSSKFSRNSKAPYQPYGQETFVVSSKIMDDIWKKYCGA